MLKTVKEVILLLPPYERSFYSLLPFNQSVDTCRVAGGMWLSCRTPQQLQAGTQICVITLLSLNCWAIWIIPRRAAWALSELSFTPSPCPRLSRFHTQGQSLNFDRGCSSIFVHYIPLCSMLDTVHSLGYIWHTLRFGVSRDSSVGIAASYWLDNQGVGVRVPVGSRIFTSPCRSDSLWGPPNLLSNGYRRLFPRG
jgi:hypothetical protein